MPKFQVFKSIREVFAGVTRHYFEMIRVARYAVALLIVAQVSKIIYLASVPEKAATLGKGFWWLMLEGALGEVSVPMAVVFALVVASGVVAAVQWHRFVLLGERNGHVFGTFRLGYFWSTIKIAIVGYALILAATPFVSMLYIWILRWQMNHSFWIDIIASKGFALAFTFPMLIWASRASLALPEIALGGVGGVFDAWKKTRGNGLRLLAYAFIIQTIVSLGFWLFRLFTTLLLNPVFGSFITSLQGKVGSAVDLICLPLKLYALMIGVTTLSVAYREIIGLPTADNRNADGQGEAIPA